MSDDIYVVVCKNDIPHPRFGPDKDGEIIIEAYTKNMRTKSDAQKVADRFKRNGECRIGLIIFDEKLEGKNARTIRKI